MQLYTVIIETITFQLNLISGVLMFCSFIFWEIVGARPSLLSKGEIGN